MANPEKVQIIPLGTNLEFEETTLSNSDTAVTTAIANIAIDNNDVTRVAAGNKANSTPEKRDVINLNLKLLTPGNLGPVEEPTEEPETIIEIWDDRSIAINGTEISTDRSHRNYLLNVFIIADGNRFPESKIADLDENKFNVFGHWLDYKTRSAALKKSLANFANVLESTAGRPILINKDDGEYQLSGVKFEDLRNVDQTDKSAVTRNMKEAATPPIARFKSNASTEYRREREEDIVALNVAYRNHPEVLAYLERYRDHNRPINTEKNYYPNFKLLTKEDEIELFNDLEIGLDTYKLRRKPEDLTPQQNDELLRMVGAYQVLYMANMRLVNYRVRRFTIANKAHSIEAEDLTQEASIGLFKAITHFDAAKGYKFSVYAWPSITDKIKATIATKSRLIGLSRKLHRDYAEVKRITPQLTLELAREPTLEEVSEATGIKLPALEVMERFGDSILLSLDAPYGKDGTTETRMDYLSATTESDPDKEHLTEALSNLNENQRLAISLKFKIYLESLSQFKSAKCSYESFFTRIASKPGPVTPKDIAWYLGIPDEAACQIIEEALLSLKLFFDVPMDGDERS